MFAAAAGLAIAGWIVWKQTMNWTPTCPDGYLCPLYPTIRHQAHPLRAELLWTASGFFALGDCVWSVRLRVRPRTLAV
jgi:hypothetical protein